MVVLIQNTNFSIQFVLDKINAHEGGGGKGKEDQQQQQQIEGGLLSQLESFDAKNISEGSAFLSIILRLTLHWRDGPQTRDLPSSIIMKVPGPQHKHLTGQDATEMDMSNPEDREMIEFLIEAHQREIQFYQHFPRLAGDVRIPKFYFGSGYHPSHQDGIILMEDLTPRGVTVPVLPGFTDIQVRELLAEMAKVHTVSWKYPEWLEQIGSDEIHTEFIDKMRENAIKMKELDSAVFGPLIDDILPLFTSFHAALSNYREPKFGFPQCLVHSDLWSANVLWEKDANGKATDRLCAIIDWQCVHAGNPCEDILRILSLNTTGEYRRENEAKLLEFYATKVAEGMDDGKTPFTMEQLKEAYTQAMPFTMMYLCFGAPFYYEMDSVVGTRTEPTVRKQNQRELLKRCQLFLEDTLAAFKAKLF